jgi:hypothetical protein
MVAAISKKKTKIFKVSVYITRFIQWKREIGLCHQLVNVLSLGKVRLGKVRLGKVRLGKVRLGKVRLD